MSIENAILEHSKALNNLADAIRATGISTTVLTTVGAAVGSTSDDQAEGQIFWRDPSDEQLFGVVDSQAEYDKLKKKQPKIIKIPESKYNDLVAAASNDDTGSEEEDEAAAEAKKKADAAAKKKADADAKKKADADAKKKADADAKKKADAGDAPSVQDLIDTFTRYLPKDLDKDERAERAGFVKPMLARFGAAKASEIPEEHRALAINMVQRKMAGEDVDPETAEFEEIEEDGLV